MGELDGRRFLVTGGAGFIGSHLVDRLLAEGAERAVVVDSFFIGMEENLSFASTKHGESLKVFRDDASDFGAMAAILAAEAPDVVVNMATKALLYSFFNPAGACRVNVDIALTLCELLRAGAFGRLVHVSSSEVYGSAKFVPMTEDHPLLAETTYAAGKAAADLVVAAYVNMFSVEAMTVRPFNNYGPRQNAGALGAVVPVTIKRLERGETPVVEGDGLQTRDFMYVEDTVGVLVRLIKCSNTRGHVVNVATGRETSIMELVQMICNIYGYTGQIRTATPRTADVTRHCSDVTRLRRLLGPLELTPLEAGLQRTVDWYTRRGGG